jgi:imidazole glycerol-phosphate synthase subunit HisF
LIRIIPRLDIKSEHLIKGIKLEGLRKMGKPDGFALDYYLQGADELLYMDAVASLYGRNHLSEMVREIVKSVFIPITVGGGIRSVEDAYGLLRSGADKIAVNTAAVANPSLITELATTFGSQAVVISIEAIRQASGNWLAFTDNGREHTGRDVVNWAKEAESLGAGEILLTSVDREGGRKGYDLPLIKEVCRNVTIPVIASGGMGKAEDGVLAVKEGAHAISMADALHYKRFGIKNIKATLSAGGMPVRPMNDESLTTP